MLHERIESVNENKSNYWTVVQSWRMDNINVEISRSESTPPRFGIRVGYVGLSGQVGGWLPVDTERDLSRADTLRTMILDAEAYVKCEAQLWARQANEKQQLLETQRQRAAVEQRRRRTQNLEARAAENRARAGGGGGGKKKNRKGG